jgi:hypothetical protein
MLQIQPTKEITLFNAARERAGGSVSLICFGRLSTAIPFVPPPRFASRIDRRLLYTLDLNHLPTAVGGISTFCAKPDHPGKIRKPNINHFALTVLIPNSQGRVSSG